MVYLCTLLVQFVRPAWHDVLPRGFLHSFRVGNSPKAFTMGCKPSKLVVYNVEEEQQRLSERRYCKCLTNTKLRQLSPFLLLLLLLLLLPRLNMVAQSLNQNIASAILDKNITDFYSIDHSNILGTGISGNVKTVRSLTSGTMYALKTLYKTNVTEKDLTSLRTEIDMMAKLDHPNILRVHEYFETDKEIFVIMPLCRGGELLDRLNAQKKHRYTESVAAGYMRTICRAISYCHANGIFLYLCLFDVH